MAKTNEPLASVTLTSPRGAVVTVAARDKELYLDTGYSPVSAPVKAAKTVGKSSK